MKELKIVATIVAKQECNEAVYAALKRVVDGTRTESGNISYELHRDISNSFRYVILEHWSSQQAIELHNQSPHFLAFVKEIEGIVESLDVVTVEMIY
ncbi:MAG: putative quinol monooxygenase [Rikenellaceae bacterium]